MQSDIAAATVQHTREKMSKEAAGYKHGLKQAHCGVCKHYQHPHACTIVEGKIFPAMWCRYFERAK